MTGILGQFTALAGALLVLLLAAPPGSARAQTQEEGAFLLTEADWPCHAKYRLAFSSEAYWRRPVLGEATEGWRHDREVRKLAEELAMAETMLRAAERRVEAFGATLAQDGTRNRRLSLLFHAVLDEINLYRRFILEGIVGFIARHRLAAEVLARTETELRSLPEDDPPNTAKTRKKLEERRFWQDRAVDDAMDEARFLCKRLDSLDAKLGILAHAITGQLSP